MILLIFTVSTGDQSATPAALPRCPWEPVSPAAAAPAPKLPSVSGFLAFCAPKLFQLLRAVWTPLTPGQEGLGTGVCGPTHGRSLLVLGKPSFLPQCFSPNPLIRDCLGPRI